MSPGRCTEIRKDVRTRSGPFDPSSAGEETRESRCPPEIWLQIFEAIFSVPLWRLFEDPMNMFGTDDHGNAIHHYKVMRHDRTEIRLTFTAVSCVCRAWKDLVARFACSWFVADSWNDLRNAQRLNDCIDGQTLGRSVRRMDFEISYLNILKETALRDDLSEEFASALEPNADAILLLSTLVSQAVMARVSHAVSLCPQLVCFVADFSLMPIHTSMLDVLPRAPLQSLTISGMGISYRIAVRILAQCPDLTTLDLGRCRMQQDRDGVSSESDTIAREGFAQHGARGLRALCLNMESASAPLFGFISTLSLPFLQHLALQDGASVPQEILELFMRSVGRTISSLMIGRGPFMAGSLYSAVFSLLPLCPNLVDLVFVDSSMQTRYPPATTHHGVQRVGFQTFLQPEHAQSRSLDDLKRRLEYVRSAVDGICNSDFQSLRVIRLLDISAQDLSDAESKWYEAASRTLQNDLALSCSARGVQLEDCVGCPLLFRSASR